MFKLKRLIWQRGKWTRGETSQVIRGRAERRSGGGRWEEHQEKLGGLIVDEDRGLLNCMHVYML